MPPTPPTTPPMTALLEELIPELLDPSPLFRDGSDVKVAKPVVCATKRSVVTTKGIVWLPRRVRMVVWYCCVSVLTRGDVNVEARVMYSVDATPATSVRVMVLPELSVVVRTMRTSGMVPAGLSLLEGVDIPDEDGARLVVEMGDDEVEDA